MSAGSTIGVVAARTASMAGVDVMAEALAADAAAVVAAAAWTSSGDFGAEPLSACSGTGVVAAWTARFPAGWDFMSSVGAGAGFFAVAGSAAAWVAGSGAASSDDMFASNILMFSSMVLSKSIFAITSTLFCDSCPGATFPVSPASFAFPSFVKLSAAARTHWKQQKVWPASQQGHHDANTSPGSFMALSTIPRSLHDSIFEGTVYSTNIADIRLP